MYKYRADIDGLRAIAVLGVIIYHAFPQSLKGGFVGVDVFFVISGYLITGIIYKEFGKNFNLYGFYKRRARRVFPALLTVLITTLILGYFTLLDTEYMHLGKHVKSNSYFFINFALVKEAGYFDTLVMSKPLNHLWSLAVEEQFYIFWPLILYFSWKKGGVVTITTLLIAVSFCMNIYFTFNNPTEAFFLPFGRAWELLSGALLALLSRNNTYSKLKAGIDNFLGKLIYSDYKNNVHTLNNLASVTGFICIICNLYFIRQSHFPGFYALLPIIGTFLLISAGPEGCLNKRILSNKFLVYIGLISYPLYLWHWPILSFVYILETQFLTDNIKYVAVALSFILAHLTYIMIEKPLRSSKNLTAIFMLCISMAIVGIFGYFIEKNNGYPNRKASISSKSIGGQLVEKGHYNNITLPNVCEELFGVEKTKIASCYANTYNPKFVFIGDSHVYAYGYAALLKKLDTIFLSHDALLPFSNFITYYHRYKAKKEMIEARDELLANLFQVAKNDSVEYVVFSTRGPLYFSGEGFGVENDSANKLNWKIIPTDKESGSISSQKAFVEGYVDIIEKIIGLGKKSIFAIDVPELGIGITKCAGRHLPFMAPTHLTCNIDVRLVQKRQREYRQLIEEIKSRVPSLLVYDPFPIFCDDKLCYGELGGDLIYRDADHLNERGSKILMDDFQRWLKLQIKQ